MFRCEPRERFCKHALPLFVLLIKEIIKTQLWEAEQC